MAGIDIHTDDSCQKCFEGGGRKRSPMSSTQMHINEAGGGRVWPGPIREQDEAVRRASIPPPMVLVFIPPPFDMLLCSDHHHLKNYLMHGCSRPPLSFYCCCILFCCILWDCTIHGNVARNRGWKGGWKVAGGLGSKQAQPETGMLSWGRNSVRVMHTKISTDSISLYISSTHTLEMTNGRKPNTSSQCRRTVCSGGHKVNNTNHSAAAVLNKYRMNGQHSKLTVRLCYTKQSEDGFIHSARGDMQCQVFIYFFKLTFVYYKQYQNPYFYPTLWATVLAQLGHSIELLSL